MKRVSVGAIIFVLLATVTSARAGDQTAAASSSSKAASSSSKAAAEALAEARHAIDKGNAQWIEAWEKGDPAMVAALFTEDGSILSGNGKVTKGRRQILERQKAAMQYVGRGVKVSVTTLDVWLDGETAYETGKYSYKYQEKGKPVVDEGRYVTIWKRQKDGSWKLFMDMIVP